MKYCPICKSELPTEDFYKHKLTKDGRNTYCKSCTKSKSAKYQKDNKERVNTKNRSWNKDNPDKANAAQRRYRKNNPGFAYECSKRHLAKYPWKNAFNSMKRHTAKMQRTPSYADQEAIKFFYECCPNGCHVDHIIPLRGKTINGFHVETNLQWMPAGENMKKSNSWN